MTIFQKSVINKHLDSLDKELVEKAYQKFKENYSTIKIEEIKKLKEEEYQDGFLREIFVDIFGYTLKPANNYDLTREFKNQTDGKKSDGAILKDGKAIVVIELKSTKTKDLKSITEQAFNYKNNQPDCKYVITSNFQKLRFYIDYTNEYEEFDLFNLQKQEFELLYLILHKDSIFSDLPLKLKNETKFHEENISDKLYKDYSNYKHKIYNNLVKNNPQYGKLTLFKKSQKFLDRLLFVFFAEDTGLVPPNAISKIIDQWQMFKDNDEYFTLYSRFVKFFVHLDKGHKYKTYELPAYNGGLFAPDEILDNVEIDDEILKDDALLLSSYDFNTDVDVNILGHIFEHSLNEIEEVTAEIEGAANDKTKSKRKKDGVFYTPKYITQYIVENTVGKLCTEKREKLNIKEIEFDGTYKAKTGKLSAKGKKLFKTLENYKNWLITLKIIDPACGSGAFLNQALIFLIDEHKQIDDIIAELTGEAMRLFDTDKAILENNLYGVDINEESVEIARLSLWLRTAQKGRKLSNLNENIKCGNSLIDDPEIAGNKAFNWNTEFADIMQNGGFDAVIGNPPYTYRNAISDKEREYYKINFKSIEGNFDLYKLFIEQIINISKNNSYSSFIIPNTFLTAKTYKKLRALLLENFTIMELFDLGLDIFENVVVESIVFQFQKKKTTIQKTEIKIQRDRKRFFTDFENNYHIDLLKHSGSDLLFNTNISTKISPIIDKLFTNFIRLENICYCTVGINTGYIKSELTSENKIDERYHKMLNGKDIGRNFVKWDNEWIMYDIDFVKSKGDRGRSLPPENIFFKDKILVQRTRRGMKRKLVCYYDTDKYYNLNRLSNIVLTNEDYSLKYIYSLLNSELLDFFFNNYFNEYEVKPLHLSKLPIKEISKEAQQPFIEKANQMLELNKNFQQKKNKFLNRLTDNFEIDKLSKKLNAFYNFDFKTLVSELKKKKVVLSLLQQDEWEEYFNAYKTEINNLQNQINQTDKEIDQMVYQLYELTDEEVKIVEESVN